jgi:hypothetical protein
VRVALIHHAGADEPAVAAHARALAAAGHSPVILGGTGILRLPAAVLRVRGLDEHLAHVPAAVLALRSGRFDAFHAFSPADAFAASLATGCERVLVTFPSPLQRETIAARRHRLRLLVRAVERSGAVFAASESVRESLAWWLGAEVEVLAPGDAAAHVALYRALAGAPMPDSARREPDRAALPPPAPDRSAARDAVAPAVVHRRRFARSADRARTRA